MADNWTIPQTTETESPKKTKWWVWLIAIVLGCICLACAGFVAFVAYFGQEPEGLSLNYSIPPVVQKGESFDFVLTITNSGTQPVTVNDIDLDEVLGGSILDGCTVLDTEPHMERDYSLEGVKTFKFNQAINPGESREVIFHLQANQAGEFGGSVGVYVGDKSKRIDFVSIIIQE